MTKCLKNADGSKMTENRQKWLKNAKNVSKMLKIAQKCIFFRFSTRRFAVALQLLELSLIPFVIWNLLPIFNSTSTP